MPVTPATNTSVGKGTWGYVGASMTSASPARTCRPARKNGTANGLRPGRGSNTCSGSSNANSVSVRPVTVAWRKMPHRSIAGRTVQSVPAQAASDGYLRATCTRRSQNTADAAVKSGKMGMKAIRCVLPKQRFLKKIAGFAIMTEWGFVQCFLNKTGAE